MQAIEKTLDTVENLHSILSPTMAFPKSTGNAGSKAMEAILTTSSSIEWQAFLQKSMEAISKPLASNMLAKIGLNASATEPFKLLDHGCGLGIVAPVLMETIPRDVLERSSVLCADLSEKLVENVKDRIDQEDWVNCEARVVDAQVSVAELLDNGEIRN